MRLSHQALLAFGLSAWMAMDAAAQRPAPVAPRRVAQQEVRGQVPVEPMPSAGAPSAGEKNSKPQGVPPGQTVDPRTAERMYRHERRRAWIFRRYAGTIDMQQKVPYPELYHGEYYQKPWKPDWVHPLPPPPIRYEYGPLGRPNEYWPEDFQPMEPSQGPVPGVPGDLPPEAPAPGVPGSTARKAPTRK